MLNIAQVGVGYWGANPLRNLVMDKNCRVNAAVAPRWQAKTHWVFFVFACRIGTGAICGETIF
jgi:hypothetical protein